MNMFTDVDECGFSPCEHICTNNVGSFECSCRSEYELDNNRRTCTGMFETMYTSK